jgi:hypothetical protein
MSLPISELIAVNVLSTVAGVNVANGFTYDLTAQRHTRSGDKRAHLNCIIVQGDRTAVSDPKIPNTLEWNVPFRASTYVIPETTDATAIDTYGNIIAADIERAIMADRYRGQNAMDTKVHPSHTIVDDEGGFNLVLVDFEVNYRTSELDPRINAK